MGHEIAQRLIADGWTTGVAARRMEPLQKLIESAPDRVMAEQIDIREADAQERLRHLIMRLGGVDVFFQISGVGKMNVTLADDNIEQNTVKTNVLGFVRMVDEVYRYMAEHNGGHIVALTSIAGVRGLGAAPSYSASKAFQHNYIQSLEQQATVRHLPVAFTEIQPGFVDTPLLKGSHFPMTMNVDEVVDELLWAVQTKKHKHIINWKYRWIVAIWKLIPQWVYRHLNVGIVHKNRG